MRNGMTKVRGVFHDRDGVDRAIYNLGKESVPSDSIRVYIVDEQGRRLREIPVEQESGALRGALMGALVGAAVGVLMAALLGAPAFIVAMALAGVPFGVAFTMGHWRLRDRASDSELARGGALVEVESDELAEPSRRALGLAGAERVSG